MYLAKRRESGVEVHRHEDDRHSPDRLALVGELREALAGKSSSCSSSPRAEPDTGAVRGVLALVRWRHPRHGLLLPEDFVPLAADTG